MTDLNYIGDLSFSEFMDTTRDRHPDLADMIDPGRVANIEQYLSSMNQISWEFEDHTSGRGAEYNEAQLATTNRAVGMTRLLQLFSPCGKQLPGPDAIILDALAGDGTVRRFVDGMSLRPEVISADLSAFMVAQCLVQGLPCIRQSADASLLRDDMLDGVLIAYGSHHLPAAARPAAAAEASRTLKPGGRFVLHDFEIGGPVDAWFSQVVHPNSVTGHDHRHFSRPEMHALMQSAGFAGIDVFDVDDPFTLHGSTADEARCNLLRHLHNMYGLTRLPLATEQDFLRMEDLVVQTLGAFTIDRSKKGWTAHLNRVALVAVGSNPS